MEENMTSPGAEQKKSGNLAICRELPHVKFDHLAELGFERLGNLPLKLPKQGHYIVRATAERLDIFEITAGISEYSFPSHACEGPTKIEDGDIHIGIDRVFGFELLVLHTERGQDVDNAAPVREVKAAAALRSAQVRSAIQQAAASTGATKVSRE